MGNFAGHALPAVFFYSFGIRWTFVVLHSYKSCKTFIHVNKWESWIKLLCCTIGILGEFTQTFVGDNNIHHILMYAAFALNSGIELLELRSRDDREEDDPLVTHSSTKKQILPPNSVNASLLFALFVQAVLMSSHTHGSDALETKVHQLQTFVILLSMTAVVTEMLNPHHVLCPLFRCFCFLTQGSWFMSNAFVLYNPFPGVVAWDSEDHVQLMNISSLFICHLFANIAVMFCIALYVFGNRNRFDESPEVRRHMSS